MKLVDMLKSEIPEYTTSISSGEIKFRPFLVKEEKNLLLVVEEGEIIDIMRAIKNLLECCFEGLDTAKISLAESEYLFLKLRERSVGSTLDLVYRPGDGKKPINVQVDLKTIKCPKRKNKMDKAIVITDKISVNLKDLSLDDIVREKINVYDPDKDGIIKILALMIDKVTMDEEVLSKGDLSIKDKIEFIESMIEPQFNKIAEFAQSAPSLSYTHNKDDVEFTLTGLNDFFSLVSLT